MVRVLRWAKFESARGTFGEHIFEHRLGLWTRNTVLRRATGDQEIDEDFMLSTMSSHTGILGPRGSDRGVPRLTNAPNRQYTTYKCTLRVYCIIRPLKLYCLRIERMFIIHYAYTVPCSGASFHYNIVFVRPAPLVCRCIILRSASQQIIIW